MAAFELLLPSEGFDCLEKEFDGLAVFAAGFAQVDQERIKFLGSQRVRAGTLVGKPRPDENLVRRGNIEAPVG